VSLLTYWMLLTDWQDLVIHQASLVRLLQLPMFHEVVTVHHICVVKVHVISTVLVEIMQGIRIPAVIKGCSIPDVHQSEFLLNFRELRDKF
jgi:hypothetical protein